MSGKIQFLEDMKYKKIIEELYGRKYLKNFNYTTLLIKDYLSLKIKILSLEK